MTWRSRRSFTGSVRVLLPLFGFAFAVASPDATNAQRLKLRSLNPAPSEVVGPWVSYRVRSRTFQKPIREYTQRVAVVARERWGDRDGVWIELKTLDPTSGMRLERGFFVAEGADGGVDGGGPSGEAERPGSSPSPSGLRLLRYQVLAAGGKLYEYEPYSDHALRAAGEIAAFELFEFDPSLPPRVDRLGPDTLMLGRRVVPALVERYRRPGDESWTTQDDSLHVKRIVLTRTLWKNPVVPITGLARSLFIARWERILIADSLASRDAAAVPDSAVAAFDPATPAPASAGASSASTAAPPVPEAPSPALVDSTGLAIPEHDPSVLTWTELTLLDLGADAVPEVTIEAEPAPGIGEEEPSSGLVR